MIEFLVDLPCPVKEGRSPEALMRALKGRARAEEATAAARAEGVDEAAVQVRLVRVDGEGGERTEITSLRDLRAASDAAFAEIAELAPRCEGCPARVTRAAFGCYGGIGYPIAAATEEFVMDRLPPVLGTVGGSFLVRAVREMAFDGGPVARMRAEGRTFFERERPVAQRWVGEGGTWEVTSDQILHMMFFSGRARPSHALLLALVLGVVPHGIPPDALEPAIADGRVLAEIMDPIAVPPALARTQIGDVVRFLDAVRRAVSLGCDLLVDA